MTVYGLLGPIRLGTPEKLVDPGPPRQRCVLAALLVDVGRLVTWDTLIDRVWGDFPPDGARHSIYSHVARIRRVLAQLATPDARPRLVRQPGGYLLDVDPDLVDMHRFRNLVDRARGIEETSPARVALLRAALGLWRGEPLAGLTGRWAAQVRQAWRQQHLDVTVAWARAAVTIGNPATVLGPLTELLDQHPFAEPAAAVLIRALADTGREAEALDRYAGMRRRLVRELGAEPGPELRDVHGAILRGELSRATSRPPAWATPRQLPPAPGGFVGRTTELARLHAALAEVQPVAVPIVTLSGMAGVGKTTLAVNWAHRVADRFPDGQLYVNLRGFAPGFAPMSPADALRGFLDALGMSPHRIPAGMDAQIALYRSLMAGRRVLIVLDNARDAGQVRPLLPGSPGCLVVVSSRDALSGLTAAEGAHPMVLSPLSDTEARQLLALRLGSGRVGAEPDAVDDIVVRCGRLPVALAVVAARAAAHPDFALAAIAEELRGAAAILDALGSGDATTDVRAVFSWSYQALSPAAARMFRLLAMHTGTEIGIHAAASLADTPVARAGRLLAELARGNLICEPVPGRFAWHDLLRAFAAELANTADPEAERRAATGRMLDYYLRAAHAADRLLDPHREPVVGIPASTGVPVEHLDTIERAVDWFAREHATLLAGVELAATTGMAGHAWQLAWCLSTFHVFRGHWHDQLTVQRIGVAAARRVGSRVGLAPAHHYLGRAHIRLRQYDDARTHLSRALELYEELASPSGQAEVHYTLGWLADLHGDVDDALHRARRCHDLYRAAGDPVGQARALNALGLAHSMTGQQHKALAYCWQAVVLSRETGSRQDEAAASDSLGLVHSRLGHHRQSVSWYRHALMRLRENGDRYGEAATLTHLGDALQAQGDPAAATDAWTHALAILDELDHPEARRLRAKAALGGDNRRGAE